MTDHCTTQRVRQRARTYILTAVGLFVCFMLVRNFDWTGSSQLHTVMEAVATLLSLIVGVLGLVRYHTKPDNTILLIGAAFLGTSFLDGYHAVVTSTWFAQAWPSPPADLIAWSWNASRTFLAVLMYLSWVAWRREKRLGAKGLISNRTVYLGVGALTLLSFLFFAFVRLPAAYYDELIFGRPEEFVSAFFFLLALVGYLRKGAWKTEAFEHWVVLSLVVGVVCQAVFMSLSHDPFDTMFDMAHLLKKVSYVCVLAGLLISLFQVLVQAERDKVELRKHRDKLLERTADLEMANRELADYDHVVAHDLRAPLRGIRQYVDFLKEDLKGTLEGEQLEYLEGLTESTAKADTLVGDLLNLSQVGRKNAPAERIQAGDFLMEICGEFAFPQNVTIDISDDWPVINIEPILFRMIFQNLIGNAAKFNESSTKKIELSWREPDAEHWEFCVRDNGIGIAPRFHEKIYRTFERLHSDEEFEGTGIGLAIVRKAVNHLHGSVRIESNLGEGSAFHVTLPKSLK